MGSAIRFAAIHLINQLSQYCSSVRVLHSFIALYIICANRSVTMWKRNILTAEEIEHDANMATMELDLANSGRQNSDSDDYHSNFEDDDPLYSPNEDDVQNLPILTQYMANKLEKFGIKFWMLGDAQSKHMCKMLPYLGKDDHRRANESLTKNVVSHLLEPFINKG